jgi:hypothetical protein
MWTNTSGWPLPSSMKPKPLAELKNFTVPVFMTISFQSLTEDCFVAQGARQTVQVDFERKIAEGAVFARDKVRQARSILGT